MGTTGRSCDVRSYVVYFSEEHYPHNSNPRPANAAALLRQELAATSAAGALDADSIGSDAFNPYQTP